MVLFAALVVILPVHLEAAVIYSEDFEASDGGYEVFSGGWECGSPSDWPGATTPDGTCWGTVLDGNYLNGVSYYLKSVSIDLTGYPDGSQITVTWKQAWEVERNFEEVANIYVRDANTDDTLSGLWSNGNEWAEKNNWQELSADISAAAGHVVQLHFSMYDMDPDPMEPTIYRGLYIDDIVIEGPELTTYTITTTAGPHGTVSPDNPEINNGDDITLTIVADAGYKVDHLEVEVSGDEPVFDYSFTGSTYTLENVSNDISFTAVFDFDDVMLSAAGVDALFIDEGRFSDELPGSPELSHGVESTDYACLSFGEVGSPDFAVLTSGDLPLDQEVFLQGLSFDLSLEISPDVEMPVLVTNLALEVSRDVLGEELCASIDLASGSEIDAGAEENIAEAFFRYVRLVKLVGDTPCDLYALATEQQPESTFFHVYREGAVYTIDFTVALVDREGGSAPAVQALADETGGFFFIFDGARDGHFRDPLVLTPLEEDGPAGSSGGCQIGNLAPAALLLLPLVGLLKRR